MSDLFLVTDYIMFNFIPHLIIPLILGLIIIGLVTRFVRSGMNI
jgi:hypothetical protein